jgi:Uma2 family endonuclease
LCVEVLSPNDRPGKLQKKLVENFASGVRLVWVVDPEAKTVGVYHSATDCETIDERGFLEGGDVVHGFRCAVAEIFE